MDEKELTNKEKREVVFENPQQGETVHYPKEDPEEETIAEGLLRDLEKEEAEEITNPLEMGGPSPTDGKQELPSAGPPLSIAEQLAHTQTAYRALLEDFTKVSQKLCQLKEVPGDAIQVASLQGQVSDLKQRVSELDEAVKLKQQVIDKLETRVTDLQMASQEVPIQEPTADVKILLKQIAGLEEANRVLLRRSQGTV